MKLDFSNLEKATFSLEEALNRSADFPHDKFIRDSVIQRFEYTYELCLKMLRRQLEKEAASAETIDSLSFKDLLREALEKGIHLDMQRWLGFRDQRNMSTHTYDERKAQSVYQAAKIFLPDAKKLLEALLKRSHD